MRFSQKYFLKTLMISLILVVDFKISKNATKLPKQIKYSLRFSHTIGGSRKSWRTENTYPNFQAVGPRRNEDG